MANVEVDLGQWWTTNGPQARPKLAKIVNVLVEIADDFAAVHHTTVVAADAPVAAASYAQADIQAMVDLINELKTQVDTLAAVTLKTVKV